MIADLDSLTTWLEVHCRENGLKAACWFLDNQSGSVWSVGLWRPSKSGVISAERLPAGGCGATLAGAIADLRAKVAA